jgi:hypothetical protein
MISNDTISAGSRPEAELEFLLQERQAQRQRAADLFGPPGWQDDADEDDDDAEA